MCSNNSVLLTVTKELLIKKNRDITYTDIAKAIDVDESWLKRFASRKSINNPSVVRIEKLFNYLSDKELRDLLV